MPTDLGRASIASGYTPDAFGAVPRPPCPPMGEEKGRTMQRKTEIVTLRMTPQTKQKIQELAAEAHMTVTDYLCICGLGKEIVQVDGLDQILSELKSQGRNLNQLTTLANMGKLKILRGDDLINGYTRLYEQISRITAEVK